jgi:hypothetical protein
MSATVEMLHHAKLANNYAQRDLQVHLLKPGIALRFYVIDALGFTPPPRKYLYHPEARKRKYAPYLTMTAPGKFEPTILMKPHCEEIVSWAEAIKKEYSGVYTDEISIRRGLCIDNNGDLSEIRTTNSQNIMFTIGRYLSLEFYFTETKFVYCAFFHRTKDPYGKSRLVVHKVPVTLLKEAIAKKFEKLCEANPDNAHTGGRNAMIWQQTNDPCWLCKGKKVKKSCPVCNGTNKRRQFMGNKDSIHVNISERQIERMLYDNMTEAERKENWEKHRQCFVPYYKQDLTF